MTTAPRQAPGAPGRTPVWAPGGKTGVGTSLSTESPVWFTLSHGILSEVFYPFVDSACTRDLEFLVTDGKDFFSEEKVDTQSKVDYADAAVPAFHLVNTCRKGHYRIEKNIVTDPRRPVVLMEVNFIPQQGKLEDFALFVLLNPHLGNQGADNTAWVGDFKGVPLLFANRNDFTLALACSHGWKKRSVGFVGASDGWQDLSKHKKMTWAYERAENGNVALTGEIDLKATGGKFVLALGFGRNEGESGHRARAGLLQGFQSAHDAYVQAWERALKEQLQLPGSMQHSKDMYRISAAVMRVHESKNFPGGIIASLAVPWGFIKGDSDKGYHLVWPRDMIQTVGGLLAIEKHEDTRRVLFYFRLTQDADGHWPQNMFLDGRPSWNGIQLDETAFVILLVNLARRHHALSAEQELEFWPMVRLAAAYLVRHGPVSPMDRWEEQAGYFASTLAVEIPALLIAAEVAEAHGEKEIASYLRETADAWHDAIDELIYVRGTDLANELGVDGYYVRFALPDQLEKPAPAYGTTQLANHPKGQGKFKVADIVSADALCLVRYGLRAADDPRMVNTVKAIDRTTKVDTPTGPCWHRYSHDGYGEHADGAPFDGTGVGRAWPLLAGERGHYELAAGRKKAAKELVKVMETFANDSGLLPEQIWDTADIPERELYFGKPSGSAMPLVWAHAEYVKLRRSLHEGQVFDTPPQAVERYVKKKTPSPHAFWRPDQKRRMMKPGKILRVELTATAAVRWSGDGGRTSAEVNTRDTGLGVHVADLPTVGVAAGGEVVFTIHGAEKGAWEGQEFRVKVEG